MKTLTVTLKQHTPLIHFQHDQYGATLRASEVKPKLDRFLSEKLNDLYVKNMALQFCKEGVTTKNIEGNEFYLFNRKKKWQNKHGSFNYKMSFVIDEKVQGGPRLVLRDDKFPFILCNMGKEEKELIQFSYYPQVIMKLFAHDDGLIDKIDEYLDEFLSITNFGNRQDKGFGCFYRQNETVEKFQANVLKHYPKIWTKKIEFSFNFNGLRFLYKELDKNYKFLKSGLPKKESALKKYFEPVVWEKKIIKDFIENGESDFLGRAAYIRAFLGLTENMLYEDGNLKVKIEHVADNKENKIMRFQSPILFKIFDNQVFVLADDTSMDIADQEFEFSFWDTNNQLVELPSFRLNTPDDFDLCDFLNKKMSMIGYDLIIRKS